MINTVGLYPIIQILTCGTRRNIPSTLFDLADIKGIIFWRRERIIGQPHRQKAGTSWKMEKNKNPRKEHSLHHNTILSPLFHHCWAGYRSWKSCKKCWRKLIKGEEQQLRLSLFPLCFKFISSVFKLLSSIMSSSLVSISIFIVFKLIMS